MLKLKNVLQKAGSKQADLAKALNVSQATVAQIVNHGEWPKSLDAADLQERIRMFLAAAGVAPADLASVFEEVDQADVRERISAFLAEIGADPADLSSVLEAKVSEPRANAARSVPKSKSATESNRRNPCYCVNKPCFQPPASISGFSATRSRMTSSPTRTCTSARTSATSARRCSKPPSTAACSPW